MDKKQSEFDVYSKTINKQMVFLNSLTKEELDNIKLLISEESKKSNVHVYDEL